MLLQQMQYVLYVYEISCIHMAHLLQELVWSLIDRKMVMF